MCSKQDCGILNNLHNDFYGHGVSSVDMTHGIVLGRPKGGLGFMWRKSFNKYITVLGNTPDWFSAISICYNDSCYVIINVYMPYQVDKNYDLYVQYTAELAVFAQDTRTSCITLVGDFNADTSKKSLFTDVFMNFCEENNFNIVDKMCLAMDSFTYLSPAWGTTSWLDHIVSTSDGMTCISDVQVDYDCIISDHHPIGCLLDLSLSVHTDNNNCTSDNATLKHSINWSCLSNQALYTYKQATSNSLEHVIIGDGITCVDPNCTLPSHKKHIDDLYNDITECLHNCAKKVSSSSGPKFCNTVPGWNDYVTDSHEAARDAYLLWKGSGKPRFGPVHDLMRRTRCYFKYTLRKCKRDRNMIIADKMYDKLSHKNDRGFWSDVKKQQNKHVPLPDCINGIQGESQIVNMWKTHYEDIFKMVNNSNCHAYTDQLLNNCIDYREGITVYATELEEIISCMPIGKSPGPDELLLEHIKYADSKLYTLLALLFTSIMMHGYLSGDLMSSIIIPLIKNKNKSICEKSNYRPICLSNVLTKIFEKLIINRIDDCITTLDNQFGFKSKHGTDLCVFTLKEILRHYIKHGSGMYVTFLDASKAFDRVNHIILFKKLLSANVPL